ncbi:MAG TPA: hypothetical protein VKB88_43795 [Bryobacteraceae bacterium]|nr:hypothetical protein [Bryobacteraceae bacterium]
MTSPTIKSRSSCGILGRPPRDRDRQRHNQDDTGPAWLKAAEGGPEQPVAGIQGRPRSLAFEHSDLLAESQDFQGYIGSGADQSVRGDQEGEEKLDHELTVLT